MTHVSTTSAAFFEEKYRSQGDPWNFAGDAYENARYRSILRALAGKHFHAAFEPGCSIGILTRMLAAVADFVRACDFSESAVAASRTQCADVPNVTITCKALCEDEPWSTYDLVVLSEIGYYFGLPAWESLAARMCLELPSGATVVACHWLGHSTDHVLHGDEVHRVLATQPLLQELHRERHPGEKHGYRLDLWRKR